MSFSLAQRYASFNCCQLCHALHSPSRLACTLLAGDTRLCSVPRAMCALGGSSGGIMLQQSSSWAFWHMSPQLFSTGGRFVQACNSCHVPSFCTPCCVTSMRSTEDCTKVERHPARFPEQIRAMLHLLVTPPLPAEGPRQQWHKSWLFLQSSSSHARGVPPAGDVIREPQGAAQRAAAAAVASRRPQPGAHRARGRLPAVHRERGASRRRRGGASVPCRRAMV